MASITHSRRSVHAAIGLAVLATRLLTAARAHADVETARLSYDVPADRGCSDEVSFRDLVVARVGRDPFAASGRREVRVRIRVDGKKLLGSYEVVEDGHESVPHELSVGLTQCTALTTALSSSIALVLDPDGPSAPATPPPMPFPETAPAPAEKPIERAPESVRLVPAVFAGPIFAIAAAPGPSLGGIVGADLRIGARFSIGIEGRGETTFLDGRADSGDRLEATLLSGAIVPCGRLGASFACIVLRAGTFQGRAPDLPSPALGSSFFVAPGIRVGYGLALSRVLEVRAALEGNVGAVRTSLRIESREVWTAPPLSGAVHLALAASF